MSALALHYLAVMLGAAGTGVALGAYIASRDVRPPRREVER